MSLAGIAVALIFWGSLNIIYYWTAEDGPGYPPRTILLPRGWLGLDRFDKAKPTPVRLERVGTARCPLGAFWSAGHEAVSRRNRRELEALMNLLTSNHVVLKHIVLDYKNKEDSDEGTADSAKVPQGSAQPLSWFLTPLQVVRIRDAKARVAPCIKAASAWAAKVLSEKDAQLLQSEAGVERCALQ